MRQNTNIRLISFHIYSKILRQRHYFSVLLDLLAKLEVRIYLEQNLISKVRF